jgi:hypothetical protein
MTSWRSTTSQQAQDDLDELLNAALPFAEDQIRKHGQFLPFGAVVRVDGDLHLIGGDGDDSFQMLETLYAGAREDAKVIRASAFVADVRTHGGDAIRLQVEHVEGRALEIVVPYRRSRVRGRVQFADMSVSAGPSRVWTPTE